MLLGKTGETNTTKGQEAVLSPSPSLPVTIVKPHVNIVYERSRISRTGPLREFVDEFDQLLVRTNQFANDQSLQTKENIIKIGLAYRDLFMRAGRKLISGLRYATEKCNETELDEIGSQQHRFLKFLQNNDILTYKEYEAYNSYFTPLDNNTRERWRWSVFPYGHEHHPIKSSFTQLIKCLSIDNFGGELFSLDENVQSHWLSRLTQTGYIEQQPIYMDEEPRACLPIAQFYASVLDKIVTMKESKVSTDTDKLQELFNSRLFEFAIYLHDYKPKTDDQKSAHHTLLLAMLMHLQDPLCTAGTAKNIIKRLGIGNSFRYSETLRLLAECQTAQPELFSEVIMPLQMELQMGSLNTHNPNATIKAENDDTLLKIVFSIIVGHNETMKLIAKHAPKNTENSSLGPVPQEEQNSPIALAACEASFLGGGTRYIMLKEKERSVITKLSPEVRLALVRLLATTISSLINTKSLSIQLLSWRFESRVNELKDLLKHFYFNKEYKFYKTTLDIYHDLFISFHQNYPDLSNIEASYVKKCHGMFVSLLQENDLAAVYRHTVLVASMDELATKYAEKLTATERGLLLEFKSLLNSDACIGLTMKSGPIFSRAETDHRLPALEQIGQLICRLIAARIVNDNDKVSSACIESNSLLAKGIKDDDDFLNGLFSKITISKTVDTYIGEFLDEKAPLTSQFIRLLNEVNQPKASASKAVPSISPALVAVAQPAPVVMQMEASVTQTAAASTVPAVAEPQVPAAAKPPVPAAEQVSKESDRQPVLPEASSNTLSNLFQRIPPAHQATQRNAKTEDYDYFQL